MSSVAAAADLAGAGDVRDAALEHFCSSFQQSSPRLVRIFQMIRDAIAAQKPGAIDLRTVEEIFDKIPRQHRPRSAFVVAAHLMANARPDEAKKYWLIVADRQNTNAWWRVIALSILRERYAQKTGGQTLPREI